MICNIYNQDQARGHDMQCYPKIANMTGSRRFTKFIITLSCLGLIAVSAFADTLGTPPPSGRLIEEVAIIQDVWSELISTGT